MDNKNNEKKEYLLTDEDLKEISGGTSSKTRHILPDVRQVYSDIHY